MGFRGWAFFVTGKSDVTGRFLSTLLSGDFGFLIRLLNQVASDMINGFNGVLQVWREE
jgi:hypothetical protein